ncbi:amidohydrolase family protein [Nonomuraea turcica]|uniref:amidohydrolase family protein n=1 Tax=Nonomuraea sp. G32 TaxID=3067274 RepID=UPI00273C065B|nr:amidohydrolase family protein [Nonomuraea sp. G32]MDP4508688.1 amidohydrolase family protein [Nonomuraea sp. G32]
MPIVLHSAPLVLPVCDDPLRDGAVVIRGDRVLQVGSRAELLSCFPVSEERRWPGMIVAGPVDACSIPPSAARGVTARASVVCHLAEPAGMPGITYIEVNADSEEDWEERERDAVITAIREIDRPFAVGIAARTRNPQVLEDVAVLARTFGLRLLADLDRHSPAALDEAGVLGPLCHVTCTRSLDPGERKLLRLRETTVALCPSVPPPVTDALALLDEGNSLALGTGREASAAGPLGLAAAIKRHARELGLRPRGLDRKLVEAATLGGARALGMDRGPGRIGSLGPGARADFAVFDARGRYPYPALLAGPPCVGTVVGGVER